MAILIDSYWDGRRKIKHNDRFCSCCGSRFKDLSKLKTVPKSQGIDLFEGKQLEEMETDKFTVKHLETRNGTITIRLQHLW